MICPVCGATPRPGDEICWHHFTVRGGDMIDWASGNRAACDFYHRGVVHPELDADREPPRFTEVA